MKKMNSSLKCTGQMFQTLRTRYKEHTQASGNNNDDVGYLNLILHTGHAYGSMTDTIKVVKIDKKYK
jgi:Cys-tRNA synthase (O-phospho-L-seryl-tRNA:Cys-tRNA synthase)